MVCRTEWKRCEGSWLREYNCELGLIYLEEMTDGNNGYSINDFLIILANSYIINVCDN